MHWLRDGLSVRDRSRLKSKTTATAWLCYRVGSRPLPQLNLFDLSRAPRFSHHAVFAENGLADMGKIGLTDNPSRKLTST